MHEMASPVNKVVPYFAHEETVLRDPSFVFHTLSLRKAGTFHTLSLAVRSHIPGGVVQGVSP